MGVSIPTNGDSVRRVRIFATADRGMAMAHIDGKVAFVPWTAPGDVAEVVVTRNKRRFVETRLVRVVEPSPLRRTPPCPVYGRCGGCQWQHLPYGEQLEAKDRSYRSFLNSRLGADTPLDIRPPLPSPREWGYRNRVGLKVRRLHGRVRMGFFEARSHRLVEVISCPVVHQTIGTFLPLLREFLQGFPPAHGHLPQVDLQVDDRGGLWVVLHLLRPPSEAETSALEQFAHEHRLAGTFVQVGRKNTLHPVGCTPDTQPFAVTAGGLDLDVSVAAGGFVQANRPVNQAMVDEVIALTDRYRGRGVLDLYAGSGNFTLPLAQEASDVLAVEAYPPAAHSARRNAAMAGFDHVRVLGGPTDVALSGLAHVSGSHPFVLLDPPREGAARAMAPLLALSPAAILYVSCAPPTLVRDLKSLIDGGYRIVWTRISDMFPQTAHVESLTLLERL